MNEQINGCDRSEGIQLMRAIDWWFCGEGFQESINGQENEKSNWLGDQSILMNDLSAFLKQRQLRILFVGALINN